MNDNKVSKKRILVYGLTENQIDGTCTFILNMQKYMSEDIVFDHIIEGKSSIYEKTIKERGGFAYYIAPKKYIFKNIYDWIKVLLKGKKCYSKVYFNLYNMTWIVPVVLCRLLGYEVAVHAHNNMLHNVGLIYKSIHWCNRQIQKMIRMQRLANSCLSAKFFYDETPSTIVKCAIRTDEFCYDSVNRENIRKNLNLKGRNVYGFVGRVAYQKNPLFLMKVFREIQQKDNLASFLVCGDGNMMKETQTLAKKYKLNVIFLGDKKDVSRYYSAMDIFVLPSLYEGLGIVLIEAQTSGLPCVTSKDVVPQDAKVTDLLEFISLKESPEEWANKIINKRNHNMLEYRKMYADMVKKTDYNIIFESKKLEKLLCM